MPRFALLSRILHWLMAAMLLAMLFIGLTMVSSLGRYSTLVAVHRPLGIAILILAIIRMVSRRLSTLPPFLETMSARERVLSSLTERVLYATMIALPIVGWAMLSAGSYPIVLCGSLHLPPILPASPMLYAALRRTHTILACVLLATFLWHLGGVLVHQIVVRDRIIGRMSLWPRKKEPR